MSCETIYPSIGGTKKCPELRSNQVGMLGLILPSTMNPFRNLVGDTSTLTEFTGNVDTEATFILAKDAVSPDTMMLSDRITSWVEAGSEQNLVEFDGGDSLKTTDTDTIITVTFVRNQMDIDTVGPGVGDLNTQSINNFNVFHENQCLKFVVFGKKDSKTGDYPMYFNYDSVRDYAGFFEAKLVRVLNSGETTDGLIQMTVELRVDVGEFANFRNKMFITNYDPYTAA